MTSALDASPKPVIEGTKRPGEQVVLYLFVIAPFLAFLAAVPVAWGWGIGWVDVALFVAFYSISLLGITVGYHRHFTHGSFKAVTPLRVALAVAGSMAVQGPLIRWVADHRRHHAFSDREGDPHSPWRFGTTPHALLKGMWHAHLGWLFDEEHTNREKYAPDLMADKPIRVVSDLFPLWVAVSLTLPAVLGGLLTWSVSGALSAFFWAGLVRLCIAHHMTWSINSVCHVVGERPFGTRDRSTNFWPLALFSFGEAWHNLHHAEPTSARHGVLRGQIDASARLIWLFEKLGWAYDVRWPRPERVARLRAQAGRAAG